MPRSSFRQSEADHDPGDGIERQDAVYGRPVAINGKGNPEGHKLAFCVQCAFAKLPNLKLLKTEPERRKVTAAVAGEAYRRAII